MFYYLLTEGKKSHFDLPTQVKFQHVVTIIGYFYFHVKKNKDAYFKNI